MCVVSMVSDGFHQDFQKKWPQFTPLEPTHPFDEIFGKPPTRQEFNALKAEVEALKKLLIAAKEFDRVTGQPDCEMADKVAMIKKVAEMVGVDMKDVFND